MIEDLIIEKLKIEGFQSTNHQITKSPNGSGDFMTVKDFKKEVFDFAKRIGVKPKEIHIRPMKRKLANCSSRGRLTFSSELLETSAKVRRHAIIHELLHLKYPNHGRIFKLLLNLYSRD